MSEARLIRSGNSAAFLDPAGDLRRQPRAPRRPRPPEFRERFEDRALWYDCFWHHDGARILLCGPPPMNLWPLLRRAEYLALPSRTPLRPAFHRSLSTMITALDGAPAGTTAIVATLGGQHFELPLQPSHAAEFARRRVLFTMSRDNDLAWIAEWARWHAALHGTDAIVLFDNGSSRYATGDLEETLLAVPGIAKVAVQSWPYTYGMTDTALIADPFYGLFLQVTSMSVALRRFAPAAFGLLNCDVDELASAPDGRSIFELTKVSPEGLVVMRGKYLEPVAADAAAGVPITHRHFAMMMRDPGKSISRPKKWALDPERPWVNSLDVHPYMHWIKGRPWFGKTSPRGLFYRHFRGINTNWKDRRTESAHLRPEDLIEDAEFADLVARHAF